MKGASLTGAVNVAGAMESAGEKLKSYDGIDNHNEHYKQGDMQQRDHRFEDGIQYNLKTCPPHANTHTQLTLFICCQNNTTMKN